MEKYKLPILNFKFDELEPHIDSRTIEIHYFKHHQAYIDNANMISNEIIKRRKNSYFSDIKKLKDSFVFNYNGHVLHSLYWENLCPSSKCLQYPSGKLFDMIEKKFTSYGNFVKEFKNHSLSIEGSGWTILVLNENELNIISIEKHQNIMFMYSDILLVCDMWEHAYYLKYQNRKSDYIDAFFNITDWKTVEKRFEKNFKN